MKYKEVYQAVKYDFSYSLAMIFAWLLGKLPLSCCSKLSPRTQKERMEDNKLALRPKIAHFVMK